MREPEAGEVLVQMVAIGACHTDLHAIGGDWGDKATFPLIPGHEGVGIITKKGTDAQRFEIGDRVGIAWLYSACGVCEFCNTGRENMCPHQKNSGFSVSGCMSEYITAKAAFVAPIPESLSSEEAARKFVIDHVQTSSLHSFLFVLLHTAILCAGLTAYKAIKATGVRPGEFLAVVGAAGGVGHLACQYGKAMGLRVIAIDVGEEKKAFCESLGVVELALDSSGNGEAGDQVAEEAIKLSGGGAHGVICCATHPAAFKSSIQITRRGGTMVAVGLCPGDMQVPIVDLVLRSITVRGTIVGTRQDLHEALGFAERGQVKCHFSVDSLDNVNEVFHKLMVGEVTGRVVLQV